MYIKSILTITVMGLFLAGCATVGPKPAKNELGKAYELYNGLRVKNDYKQAFDIANKSCNSNDISSPYGCFLVGWEYYNGKGVSKDYQKAFEYFNKGCENIVKSTKYNEENEKTYSVLIHSQRACYMVGKMYEKGLGVPVDYIKAFQAYEKAFIKEMKETKKGEKTSNKEKQSKTPPKQIEDVNIELFRFPDLESNISPTELSYSLRNNQILNHQFRKKDASGGNNFIDNVYENTALNIQEGTDMGFFTFNDYILSLTFNNLASADNGVSELLNWRIKQIFKDGAYENKKTATAIKNINQKIQDAWFVQEGTLYALKNENKNYTVVLDAIINTNPKLDLNKAIAFYDHLIKIDEELRKTKCTYGSSCKAVRRDVLFADKIFIFAYNDLGRLAYMNKGVANEMLYAHSKNQIYFNEALKAYGKACDFGYVLGCAFYKNLNDGLTNVGRKE